MSDTVDLRGAYDSQPRPAEASDLPDGVHAEPDGPGVRVVGWHRGFVSSPNDLGLSGGALDTLIARQRNFFAAPPGGRGRPTNGRPAVTAGPRS